MQKIRNLISLILLVIMLLTLSIGSLADDNETIINEPVNVTDGVVLYPDEARNITVNGVLDASIKVTNTPAPVLEVNATAADTSIEVTGDVEVKNEYATEAKAVVLSGTQEAHAVIDGDVTASSGWNATAIESYTGGQSNVITVEGNVSATSGTKTANGISAGGNFTADIAGNVTATSDGTTYPSGAIGLGLSVGQGNDEIDITVHGNVEATGTTNTLYGIQTTYNSAGAIAVTVCGDVSAENKDGNKGYGIMDKKSMAATTEADYYVEGTVSGGSAPIYISNGTPPSAQAINNRVTFTIWEAQPINDKIVIVADDTTGAVASAVEEAIQYIIKVDPDSQQYISSLGGDAKKAGKEDKYDVAHQNETVTFNVSIPDGYELKGAFGDKNNTAIQKDAEGNYYITVPRGGGVYITLKVDKKVIEEAVKAATEASVPVTAVAASVVVQDTTPPKSTPAGKILVSAVDKSGQSTIDFIDDGTLRMYSGDGSADDTSLVRGRFWFDGKKINLAEKYDPENGIKITQNNETKLFEFSFLGASFEMNNQEVKRLCANRMDS